MTYIEFFAQLASEMTGAPMDIVKRRMLAYEQNIENEKRLSQEIPQHHADRLRAAAKSDPEGFARWVDKSFESLLSASGLKME